MIHNAGQHLLSILEGRKHSQNMIHVAIYNVGQIFFLSFPFFFFHLNSFILQ